MRHGCRANRFTQMTHVRTQCGPQAEQDGEGSGYGGGEYNSDDLGRRLGVLAEDVVDFWLGGVAQRGFRDGERNVGIAGDGEVEDGALEGGRGAEGAEDDGGRDGGCGGEELVW